VRRAGLAARTVDKAVGPRLPDRHALVPLVKTIGIVIAGRTELAPWRNAEEVDPEIRNYPPAKPVPRALIVARDCAHRFAILDLDAEAVDAVAWHFALLPQLSQRVCFPISVYVTRRDFNISGTGFVQHFEDIELVPHAVYPGIQCIL